MTISEAIKKRIPRVRMEHWASATDYLRLPLLQNGNHGPWAELYSENTQPLIDVPVGSQKIMVPGITGDNWVEYTGPISEYEKDKENFAFNYAEK